MAESFTKKILEVEIVLSSGDFGGGNTKIIRGLPVTAQIIKPGLPEKNTARISISGLPYDDLGKLTTLAFQAQETQKNMVSLRAGDEGKTLATVFAGEIASAFADFNSAPNISLEMEAVTGYYPQRANPANISVNGEVLAADLIASWAEEIGYTFTNNGFARSVRNAVFNGSPLERIQAVARQAGADLIIDDYAIILMPSSGVREGSVPLLTPQTGMLGYPTFTDDGISVRCLYRPDLQIRGLIKVVSDVPKATGTWKISKLSHSLAAFVPGGGSWESAVEASFLG